MLRRGRGRVKAENARLTADRRPPYGWHPANGERAKLYPCGTLGQEAGQTFDYTNNKFSVAQKALGDFCLDVVDGNLGPGNELQMWQCYANNNNQVFSTS